MAETKINAKKTIILALHKKADVYKAMTTPEKAFKFFLEDNDLKKANMDLNYFKYFWKQVKFDNVFSNKNHRIYKDLQNYLTKEVKANEQTARKATTEYRPEDVEIKVFTPGQVQVNPEMFQYYLTNSEIDEIFSDDGGAMSATSIMLTGGPGVGKSTVAFWMASRLKEYYPDRKIAIVSSEMEEEDLIYETRRKPWMNSLDFILTSMYTDKLKAALQKIFLTGYHIVILDSFADVCEKLRDFCGMPMSQAENFLLDLMKKAKGGHNSEVEAEKVFTFTLAIQQVTKGGTFSGSNKLKHNTTGMLELRKESSGDRYGLFTKNRRCGQHVGKKLYYFLGANNNVSFDSERWEREKSGDDDGSNNPVQENLTNQLLSQFGEITQPVVRRARALMQQADLPDDILSLTGGGTSVSILPDGMRVEDIYYDADLTMHVLELGDGIDPIFGTTKEDVIQKAWERYPQSSSSEEELEDEDEFESEEQ